MADLARKAVLIAGPTASGKSALAVALGERLGGTIVNADSMQVYRDLQILTARPTDVEMTRVPHALYGHIDGDDAYSVGRYAEQAAALLRDFAETSAVPIFVGGTGLYFRGLTDGLAPVPRVPDEVRVHWRKFAEDRPVAALHEELARRDPVMANRLAASDRQRIVRALEVIEGTGRSLAHWQALRSVAPLETWQWCGFVVGADRSALAQRSDHRLDQMIADGALDEVSRLLARDLPPDRPIMRAIGLRPLAEHVRGRLDLDAALAAAKQETRQYIKRQQTWLQKHMIAWRRIEMEDNKSKGTQIIQNIVSSIDESVR